MKNILKIKNFIASLRRIRPSGYKSTLQKCLDFIVKCNDKIKYIYCGYCLKKFKINNIINNFY